MACLSCFRCIKVAVVPSVNVSWATKPLSELKAPKFSEVFAVTLLEHRLYTNTLQLNVWSLHDVLGDECLVSVVGAVWPEPCGRRHGAVSLLPLLLQLSFLLHFRDLRQVGHLHFHKLSRNRLFQDRCGTCTYVAGCLGLSDIEVHVLM